MTSLKFTIAAGLWVGCALPSTAQSLGGVFGPIVNEGHASAQFRTGYAPDTERWGHRVHYQSALNSDLMWRAIVQVRESANSDVDFDNFGAELFWQLTEDGQSWQSGLRFDVRLRDDDRPHSLGLNFMNQWQLGADWHARALVLTAIDTGDNSRDGVFVQTRGQLHRGLGAGQGIGLELYSAYGSSDDWRSFDEQSHEIGPYFNQPLNDDWSLWGSALVGLTDASPDSNLKLWITRRF